MTEQEYLEHIKKYEKFNQIQELKQKLTDWDHKNSKYLDGEYTEEEWAEIVNQRKKWREEIRELEKELEENDNTNQEQLGEINEYTKITD